MEVVELSKAISEIGFTAFLMIVIVVLARFLKDNLNQKDETARKAIEVFQEVNDKNLQVFRSELKEERDTNTKNLERISSSFTEFVIELKTRANGRDK